MPADRFTIGKLLSVTICRAAIILAQEANRTQQAIDGYITAQALQSETNIAALLFGESTVASTLTDAYKAHIVRVIKGAINSGFQEGSNEYHATKTPPEKLLTWTLNPTSSGTHCPDCVNRSGMRRTLAEWEVLGMPQSGFSICGNYCRCTLI